jgi:hypothetical protein
VRIHTTHTRDAALQQLHRINRWLLAGSVLLTGAFTEVAANAFPGRTVKKSAATRAKGRAHRGGVSRLSSTSTGSAAPLKPPAQAPQAAESNSSSTTQAQEAAPEHEAQATQEPAQEPPTEHEAAPAQEAPHTEASSPRAEAPHESAPEPQPEPEPEPEAVVSGGS